MHKFATIHQAAMRKIAEQTSLATWLGTAAGNIVGRGARALNDGLGRVNTFARNVGDAFDRAADKSYGVPQIKQPPVGSFEYELDQARKWERDEWRKEQQARQKALEDAERREQQDLINRWKAATQPQTPQAPAPQAIPR